MALIMFELVKQNLNYGFISEVFNIRFCLWW